MDSNSLIMKWNMDANGNPASVRIEKEIHQVSTTHNLIQLIQVPDNHYRVRIVASENGQATELREVLNKQEVTEETFYVEYGVGLVSLHERWQGRTVVCTYYGRGVILISDARIFHKTGDSFYDTYDNIMERGKDAIELLEATGGLSEAIKYLDTKIEEGMNVSERLEDFITETQFYGYTITLSREAFVVRADENGEVEKPEISSVFTDVIVYQGAKQIKPTLSVSGENGCEFKVVGQRVSLVNMDANIIKASAVVEIDCGDGLVAQRVLEVTKVFDGINQYQCEMTNGFYSFQANAEGEITEEQSVTCELSVTKANLTYNNFTISVHNAPSGLKYKILGESVIFTATKGALLPNNGSCLVVATIDDVTMNKSFVWSKNKQGAEAKSLMVVGGQVIRYETPDYSDVPTPYRSTVTAQVSGLSGTPKWYVSNNDEWVLLDNMSSTSISFMYNDALIWGDKKETTIRCELDGYSDELTIVKLATGASGSDAYTVYLTNESVTLPMDESGVIPESEIKRTYTKVVAYKGGVLVQPQITVSTSDMYSVDIEEDIVTLTSIEGSLSTVNIDIKATIDGIDFVKVWSIGKAKAGATGATGENGSTYILNITGGTRSITYSQINHDPRPSSSQTFCGELYKDGNLVTDNIGWYWSATGHFEGTGIDSLFTPTIKGVFDEKVSNNSITLIATHQGNTLTTIVPLAVTKDAHGLDWVQDWDSTKTEVRGTQILTPKIFAGTYDQANDLVTGVAIGQDVLNNGTTIGVVGYQNNIPSFLLDTTGSVTIGNPDEKNGVGLRYDNGSFKLKVRELSIEGAEVPTKEDVNDSINQIVGSAKEELRQEMNDVGNSLDELSQYVETIFKDGILDEVEKAKLENLFESLRQEKTDVEGQYASIYSNPNLNHETIGALLSEAYLNYADAFDLVTQRFNSLLAHGGYGSVTDENGELVEVNTAVHEFYQAVDSFRESGTTLYGLMNDAVISIAEGLAKYLTDRAKEEILLEVEDVNNSLNTLEEIMNNDFKSGIIDNINLVNLKSKLSQLEVEKADIDGQYKSLYENDLLSIELKNQLSLAKAYLDGAHEELIVRINNAITDYIMTEVEMDAITGLISAYAKKLEVYSGVAQQCNVNIAMNTSKDVVKSITDEEVFNKVTNYGEKQGLFINDGKTYINGQYVNTRNLIAQRDDGTETFAIDKDGNVSIQAKSFYLTGDASSNIATEDYVNNKIADDVKEQISDYDKLLNQEAIFNKLTNNGEQQGIYLENSKLYVNGEYIKAGVISSQNGKSVLNLNNGSMSLGKNTDSSYLEWTGSDLNIKAKSISIGSSTVATKGQLDEAFDNLHVGGSNLLYNSDNGYLDNLYVYQKPDEVTYSMVDGWRRFNFNGVTHLGHEITHENWVQINELGDYTFSIMCRTDAVSLDVLVSWFTNETGHNKIKANVTEMGANTYLISCTHKITTPIRLRVVDLGYVGTVGGTYIEFRYPKLEKGNTPTAWSPSFDDYSTTTQMNSLIEQTSNSIKSEVNETIENIKIGGANLFGQHIEVLAMYKVPYVTREEITGFETQGHVDNDGTVRIARVIDGNGWYTISFDVKCQVEGWYVEVDVCDGVIKRFDNISTTGYTHCSYTYEVTNYTSDVYHFIDIGGLSDQKFWFKNIKVERGQYETDYCPSFNDYSTTTQMNSVITQKANEINLGVTQTINSIQTGGKNLIKNGNFEDGLNHWVYERFSGVETTNLEVWTGNHNDYRDEWCMDGKKQCVLYVHNIDDSNRHGEWTVRQYFKTVVGQEYTISYMIAGHRSYKTVAVRENKNWGVLGFKDYGDIEGGKNANGWVYDSITFTATTSDTMVWFIMREVIYGTDAHMWFTDVCCVEGNKAQRFIPSLEEYSTTAQMNSAINVAKDSINLSVSQVVSTANGKMLYKDPTFKSGKNGVHVYNNLGNGAVTVDRVEKGEACPTNSTHMLRITTNGSATPALGGFSFGNPTRPNAVFITKILAKIPVGYTINFATNPIGNTGANTEWLTDRYGTGDWKEYIHKVKCGSDGDFSYTNYYYLGDGGSPVTWYVGMATVYDVTDTNGTVESDSIISSINMTPESIKINANKITLSGDVAITGGGTLDSFISGKMSQSEIFNRLTNYGSTQGLFLEGGQLYINGSHIKANTLSADSITSGTFRGTNFVAGGTGNNGYIEVRDYSNNVSFQASRDGIYASRIDFETPSYKGDASVSIDYSGFRSERYVAIGHNEAYRGLVATDYGITLSSWGDEYLTGVAYSDQGTTSLKYKGLETSGHVKFTSYGSGGRTNANIHNMALQSATGNGQMMTAGDDRIFVGNPQTRLVIESSETPTVKIGSTTHELLHTGSLSSKKTFGGFNSTTWTNAQIELSAGSSGTARLNFHRPNYSQMSIVHHTKDQLHIEYDNGTQARILTTNDNHFEWSNNTYRWNSNNYGTSYLTTGNGDNSGWYTANVFLRSHWGLNFLDNYGNCHICFDNRTGWIHIHGRMVTANGTYSLTSPSTQENVEVLTSSLNPSPYKLKSGEKFAKETVEDVLTLLDKIEVKKMSDVVDDQVAEACATYADKERTIKEDHWRIKESRKQKLGFTTEDLQDSELFDLIGGYDEDGNEMVSHMALISLLVMTCQQLKQEVAAIKEQLQ